MKKLIYKIPFFGKAIRDRNTLFLENKVLIEKNQNYLEKINNLILENKKIENINHKLLVEKNYLNVLMRIFYKTKKNPFYKIKVGFLVNENQKWNCQSLYEELEINPKFTPVILVSPMLHLHQNKDEVNSIENNVKENYNFFKKRKMRVRKAYDLKTKEYLDLKKFNIDILFYTQPWGLNTKQTIQNVSIFALCCYIPYSFAMFEYENNYMDEFHGLLWNYYLETKFHYQTFSKINSSNNCVVTGYPKLDTYVNSKNNSFNKKAWPNITKQNETCKKIIYAPHHSINPTPLALSTFYWNSEYIFKLAKNNPNTLWIFKPHPNLKNNYIQAHPDKKIKIEKYFTNWEKLKNAKIYNQGDYFDIFKTSDLLITDCGSFLAEYLPTGKPVIHLRTNLQNYSFNKIGEKIIRNYYQVHSLDELKNVFNSIVLNNDDFMKKSRLTSIKELGIDYSMSSAKKIVKHLEKFLEI